MTAALHGSAPSPRVAVIGSWETREIDALREFCPTVWIADKAEGIGKQVTAFEIDVWLVGEGASSGRFFVDSRIHNCIAFGTDVVLPGSKPGTQLMRCDIAGQEAIIPDVAESLRDLQKSLLATTTPLRGKKGIGVHGANTGGAEAQAFKDMLAGAIMISAWPATAIGTVFQLNGDHGRGVAWIPYPCDRVAWIRAIFEQWKRWCPNLDVRTRWEDDPSWFTREETAAHAAVFEVRERRRQAIAVLDAEEAAKLESFGLVKKAAKAGPARILSEQGDVLVEAVAQVLSDLGFEVENMDSKLPPGVAKREDLRLRREGWEAIAEVRGYRRGGAKAADLQRIQRFAGLYSAEKRKAPDKLLYIVNAPIEDHPSDRPPALKGADEDVQVFAESGGLVIATHTLFQLHQRRREPGGFPGKVIVEKTGVLALDDEGTGG